VSYKWLLRDEWLDAIDAIGGPVRRDFYDLLFSLLENPFPDPNAEQDSRGIMPLKGFSEMAPEPRHFTAPFEGGFIAYDLPLDYPDRIRLIRVIHPDLPEGFV